MESTDSNERGAAELKALSFCMGGRGPGLMSTSSSLGFSCAGGQRTPARSTEQQSPPCLIAVAAAYRFPIKYRVLVKFVMYSFPSRWLSCGFVQCPAGSWFSCNHSLSKRFQNSTDPTIDSKTTRNRELHLNLNSLA